MEFVEDRDGPALKAFDHIALPQRLTAVE